ncbi:MAG: isochorismatase family protein [Bradymonadales bacterium]|nr:isochorismatase family protein [Bradymonadales bacterium]
MDQTLFPRTDRTALVVIDIQEGLLAAIPESAGQRLVKSNRVLLELASIYEMPVFYTEHYPRGLKATIPALHPLLEGCPRVVKTEFSACHNPDFQEQVVRRLPEDVILTGIETHICILLTAIDLLGFGFRVFVPADAVASRSHDHWQNGLSLLERAGAIVTNTESLVFQRLGKAGGDHFKRMLEVLK